MRRPNHNKAFANNKSQELYVYFIDDDRPGYKRWVTYCYPGERDRRTSSKAFYVNSQRSEAEAKALAIEFRDLFLSVRDQGQEAIDRFWIEIRKDERFFPTRRKPRPFYRRP
jgi:hypothetical protein